MSFTSDPEVDKAYSPSRALPEGVFQAHMDLYRDRSAAAYASLPHRRDLCYDAASGQCLDLFPAPGPGLKPAFVFIHGGYWRMLSKNESVYMAPAFTARGIALVAPDYALAPATSLEEIVRQVRASIAWLHRHGAEHGIDPARIFVGGHSAGGHLTAALVAGGWRESFGLPEDVIKGAMPVSGVFDLEPISRSFVNEWMGLDLARANALSPIHHLPRAPCKMVVAWGGDETSGFHDQSHAWLAAWRGAGFAAAELVVPGRHHFDIVLDWCDPDSAMTRACVAMIHGELPPIELQAPDISRWKDGGTGVDWVHVLDSGRPGPRVMVQALTHGNEFCGAIALNWLLAKGFRPQRGTLTLAFANVEAYARFDITDPFPSRLIDEDYNRVWSDDALFGPRDSLELRRARELRPFVDEAELLLDIHSMSEPCRPLMVCGTVEKNVAYARELGVPGDLLVDTGHPAGMRMVDRGGFGDPASPKRALLIECGQHWEQAAADVAIDALVRFLGLTGVADAAWVAANTRLPLPPVQRLVRVTEPVVARSADFRFLVPTVGLSVVPKAGTPIAQDGDHVWTTPYDDAVLVMPGTRNLKPGGTAVRLGRFET